MRTSSAILPFSIMSPKIVPSVLIFCLLLKLVAAGSEQPAVNTDQIQQVLSSVKLNPEEVQKLAQSIKEFGPSIANLADQIQRHQRSTPQEEKGAEWMFGFDPSAGDTQEESNVENSDLNNEQKKKARGLGLFDDDVEDSPGNTEGLLFQAKRYCGYSPKVDPSLLSQAAPGQYPWAAAILSEDDAFLCSGTLISESIVLTTATCILKYRARNVALKVALGAWNIVDGHQILPELQIYVRAAVLHPSFSQDRPETYNHDIGLLRLSENVDFDLHPHVFPVCIISPTNELSVGTNFCQVLGWPGLPVTQPWRSRSHLAIGDVTVLTSNCPAGSPTTNCVVGHACVGNQGSSIICLANSQRYYQWGIMLTDSSCDRQAKVFVSVVSIAKNYDFLQKYIWTPNHALK